MRTASLLRIAALSLLASAAGLLARLPAVQGGEKPLRQPGTQAGEKLPRQPGTDFSYDEVIRDLIVNFERDKVSAQDAAVKLARLGRRAVPVLADLLEANFSPDPEPQAAKLGAPARVGPLADPPAAGRDAGPTAAKGNPQVAFYAAQALARMKFPETARPLLPVLKSQQAAPELRALVIEAAVWSTDLKAAREKNPVLARDVELGIEALMKIAASDGDLQMRKKALTQLSVNPDFWVRSEKLFVAALSDPDDEIRLLAAKQCWFTRIYLTSVDKLLELAEKDPVQAVRTNAMLALGRMRVARAVPELVRIAEGESSPALQKQCVHTVETIARVPLKDKDALLKWWKDFGKVEFARAAPAEAPANPPPATGEKDEPGGVKDAPKPAGPVRTDAP